MLSIKHTRQARPASAAYNLFKALAHTVVFWTVFLFLIPELLCWLETVSGLSTYRFASPACFIAGVLLFAFGGVLGLTCSAIMAVLGRGTPLPIDCARVLVIAGPYRYIRNPMAVAGLSQALGVALILGSPLTLAYVLCASLVWNFFVRRWEEADLERRFGQTYTQYRSHVQCWRPRLSPYAPEN